MSKIVFDTSWRESLPTLKSVIDTHDLRARKSLGQNFILDTGITDKIARAAGEVTNGRIIEIGPGPGGLTRSLLSTNADSVLAIEFDPRAVAALEPLKTLNPRLALRQADALRIDWRALLAEHPHNHIIANLPYNISTVLLIQWLRVIAQHGGKIDQMLLMFQKEVADRLVAKAASSDYGRLSVLTQWLCDTDIVMTLPPGAFVPPPKVTSCVVRLTPCRSSNTQVKWETLDELLQRAFLHRRKMLRSNLKDILSLLAQTGIPQTDRAQDVSVVQYLNLAEKLEQT